MKKPDLNIDKKVAGANMFNDEPGKRNVYASIPVTVKYVGDQSARPSNELEFTFVSAAGQSYDGGLVVIDDQLNDVDKLFPGAKGSGDVIIEIPKKDAAEGRWGVNYIFSDDTIYFGK